MQRHQHLEMDMSSVVGTAGTPYVRFVTDILAGFHRVAGRKSGKRRIRHRVFGNVAVFGPFLTGMLNPDIVVIARSTAAVERIAIDDKPNRPVSRRDNFERR